MSGLINSVGSKSGIIGSTEIPGGYETGTYTPALAVDGGSNITAGYDGDTKGIYTIIGNLVTVTGFINLSSESVSSGAMMVTLPKTSTSAVTHNSAIVGMSTGWSATEAPVGGYVPASSARIYLTRMGGSDARSNLESAVGGNSVGSNSQIAFSVTYRI